ncbi:hypothetical protein IWZ00DRAFT_81272 [Phyllosticta capitalensis]
MSVQVRKGYFVKVRRGWVPAESKRGQKEIRRKCPPADDWERLNAWRRDVASSNNMSTNSLDKLIRDAYEQQKRHWPHRWKRNRGHLMRSSPYATAQVDERTEPPADARRVGGYSDLTSAATSDTRDHDARRSATTLSPILEVEGSGGTPNNSLNETLKPKQQRQASGCTCKHHHHREQGENGQSHHHHGSHPSSRHGSQHGSQHSGHHHCYHHHHHHQHSHTNSSRQSPISLSTPRRAGTHLHPADASRINRRRENQSDPTDEHESIQRCNRCGKRARNSFSLPTTPGQVLPSRCSHRHTPSSSRAPSRQSSQSSLRSGKSAIAA